MQLSSKIIQNQASNYNGLTVGIIGGMGPDATLDLMQRLIRLTPAHKDEDHIHCIIDNCPQVPSRIKAIIEGNGEDPSQKLIAMAQGLEKAGAAMLAIACNTAHYYQDVIRKAVGIPLVSMIDILVRELQSLQSDPTITLLGTPAIRLTKLFEQQLQNSGYKTNYPNQSQETQIFEVIKAVKSGNYSHTNYETLVSIIKDIASQSNGSIVIACTELSVLLTDYFYLNDNSGDNLYKQLLANENYQSTQNCFILDTSEELAKELVLLTRVSQ